MTSIRKQLADTLRYIRRERQSDCSRTREKVEVSIDTYNSDFNQASLEELTNGVCPSDYKNVFVRGYSREDYDGYPEGYVELYTYRKETDEEYFDGICQIILPTEYQQKQYQDYLRLKQLFEKELRIGLLEVR
jgi:hypothetical protein